MEKQVIYLINRKEMMKTNNEFSKDYAMLYENIIKRTYGLEKSAHYSTSAEFYLRFLSYAETFSVSDEYSTDTTLVLIAEKDILINYMLLCGEIRGHLVAAIACIRNRYEMSLEEEEFNELLEIQILISKVSDIKAITFAINRIEKAFQEIFILRNYFPLKN